MIPFTLLVYDFRRDGFPSATSSIPTFFGDIWDLRRVGEDSHSWLFALRSERFICENVSSASLVFCSTSHHLHLLRTLLSTNSCPNFCFCFCLVFWRVLLASTLPFSFSFSASLQLYVLFSRFENTVKCVLKRMELFLFESHTFSSGQHQHGVRCRYSDCGADYRSEMGKRNRYERKSFTPFMTEWG